MFRRIAVVAYSLGLFFGVMTALPPRVAADTPTPVDVYETICNKPAAMSSPICLDRKKENPIPDFIGKLTRLFAMATGVAAVLTILISGFMYTTSEGDTSRLNSAKRTLTYAIVGLVVAALAQVIAVFVVSKL